MKNYGNFVTLRPVMRIRSKRNSIIACFLVIVLSSCGEYTKLEKTADIDYKYEAAKAAYVQGKYSRASQLFGSLLATMKGTSHGEESLYLLALSNYHAKDYESATSYFKKYYQSYPKGVYVEYARYYSGLSLFKQTADPRLDQGNTKDAIAELQSFLDVYPTTNLKEQTQEMIYRLQDKLVEKEYLSAKLYFDLGTYMGNSTYGGSNYEACVVTAQNALKDFPYATTEKREEISYLILRAKYHLAKQSVLEKRIQRYRDVVDEYYAFQNDFPESKYIKDAKKVFNDAESIVKKKKIDIDAED